MYRIDLTTPTVVTPLGIATVAGEYAAFGDYWKNFPESESRRLGQLAIAAGAIGAFDGC